MKYIEFVNRVKEEVENYYEKNGEKKEVWLHEVTKNNGIIMQVLTIYSEENPVAPSIYLEKYYRAYQEGETLQTIVQQITEICDAQQMEERFDVEFFTSFDRVKDRIVYKLINYEKNQKMLEDVPHMRYLDLAVVFYCIVSMRAKESATIMIRKEHLKMWNASREDVFVAAAKNTPRLLQAKIYDMVTMLEECMEKEKEKVSVDGIDLENLEYSIQEMKEEQGNLMYVLSNETKVFGASCVLYKGILQKFANKIGRNLFVLPSSLHEVILIPAKDKEDAKEYAQMVYEVNRTQVQEQEVLSDHVYFYDKELDQMSVCA